MGTAFVPHAVPLPTAVGESRVHVRWGRGPNEQGAIFATLADLEKWLWDQSMLRVGNVSLLYWFCSDQVRPERALPRVHGRRYNVTSDDNGFRLCFSALDLHPALAIPAIREAVDSWYDQMGGN